MLGLMPNSVLRTDGAFRGNGCLGTVAFLKEGKKGTGENWEDPGWDTVQGQVQGEVGQCLVLLETQMGDLKIGPLDCI